MKPFAALLFVLLLACRPAGAAPQTVEGVPALPGVEAAVSGTLVETPGKAGDLLEVVLRRQGEAAPITAYRVEMTKAMHVIAIDDEFQAFLHEHVDRVSPTGQGRVLMHFPHPGLYHIYVDATPAGLDRQVLRFDLPVGGPLPGRSGSRRVPSPALEASDGDYGVRFDSLSLTAGRPGMATLHLLDHGQPAGDIMPFLGVPAHAVMVDTGSLSYIHSHPMDLPPPPGLALKKGAVSPDLMLHLTPPTPGTYRMWIQFMGAGKLRTVAFTVRVDPPN